MIDSKLGFAVAAVGTVLAGCTPAQYEDAYNQVVQPFAAEPSASSAQAASSKPVETRTASTTILASETSPSSSVSEPVDFSQSATSDDGEKRFAEERDDNGGGGGGGGAGGGSGGSWGG